MTIVRVKWETLNIIINSIHVCDLHEIESSTSYPSYCTNKVQLLTSSLLYKSLKLRVYAIRNIRMNNILIFPKILAIFRYRQSLLQTCKWLNDGNHTGVIWIYIQKIKQTKNVVSKNAIFYTRMLCNSATYLKMIMPP